MPNPTTINEDHSMTIPEKISKLRARAEAVMNLTDDECEITAANTVLYEYLSASNATDIIKILDHLEARESEKPKKTDEELVEEMCEALAVVRGNS